MAFPSRCRSSSMAVQKVALLCLLDPTHSHAMPQVINEVFVQEDLTWGWGKAVDDVTLEVAEKPVTEVFDVTFISGPPVGQQISRD